MKTTLTSLLVLAAASPALLADITASSTPASPTPQTPTRVMGNCDQLASNTVRATFLGVRTIQTQTFDQAAPVPVQVAVFQVIENLAYRRLVRYGDGKLKPGACFPVAMDRALPGQPSSIVDTIAQMQPGEEAVMKIDHLYIFGDEEGKAIRPCSRMARRGATTAPQQPAVQQPAIHQPAVITPAVQQPAVITPAVPAPVAVPSPEPAAPTAPAPVQTPADSSGDDTTVEHAPQNAAAAPIPAPSSDSF